MCVIAKCRHCQQLGERSAGSAEGERGGIKGPGQPVQSRNKSSTVCRLKLAWASTAVVGFCCSPCKASWRLAWAHIDNRNWRVTAGVCSASWCMRSPWAAQRLVSKFLAKTTSLTGHRRVNKPSVFWSLSDRHTVCKSCANKQVPKAKKNLQAHEACRHWHGLGLLSLAATSAPIGATGWLAPTWLWPLAK